MFTTIDKALLMRTARHLEQVAGKLEAYMPWTAETRAAKLEYDRLKRDARDLRALGQRLSKPAQS